MTHIEACDLLGQQEQASADENDAACLDCLAQNDTRSLIVSRVLSLWAGAKRFRLAGMIQHALRDESEAEKAIDRNGFDW